ncbi:MAG: excinuclease ABC subunit UvrC [Lachnospiraceae bacterium]|nr:excinuclease ABC subunit UvrC [Lachnospiraceae bacterium]
MAETKALNPRLEEDLKNLPAKPGVYIMHDKGGNIIYIGKAKVLKNRVRQYFQSRERSPKIERMVSLIDFFEYIVVDSEIEALVLENNLIKEHRPKYNTMLMDDKTYPYVRITMPDDFPRVMIVRKQHRDKARYFGPFPSVTALRESLELLRRIYRFRSCRGAKPGDGSSRSCLYHHIGQCSAPCAGGIGREEYRENIAKVIRFLEGDYREVLSDLEKKMFEASEKLEFEEAARLRDLIGSVKTLAQKQKITNTDEGNRDIIALANDGEEAVAQVFFVRGGKMIGREHMHINCDRDETRSDILTAFVKQYYAMSPDIPRELLLEENINDIELIGDWLSSRAGRKVYLTVPRKGEKERLVSLAHKNASMVLQKDGDRLAAEEARTVGAVRSLAQMIGLASIRRIESYDISNISGFESVASMVVYEDGKPKRHDYRKFKIRTVRGPDDYASMREVLTRRFTHGLAELEEGRKDGAKDPDAAAKSPVAGGFSVFPDVILMDGGRGQVNIALEVLGELGLDIAVCGMVKDDSHRTRGLFFDNEELPIDTHSELFKLITRIQDETHRFAIEYHRSLRTKKQVHSVLDDIEGIGAKRRLELMRAFSSFEAIRDAKLEELEAVPKMTPQAARAVYDFFHGQGGEA